METITTASGTRKKILLVEDEALIALFEAQLLERNGYTVITAPDGEQAVAAVKEHSVDLILMDIDLGKDKMLGTEAAKRILNEHNIPIVFLTSHKEKEFVDKVKSITNYGYIIKNSGEFILTETIGMAFTLFNEEQRAKISEERYKKAQAAGHVGSWEYDVQTGDFWGSEEGKRIYGFDSDKDNFSSEEVMECVIDRERVDQAMIDLLERNIPYDIEFTIIPRNSEERKIIHSTAVVEKDNSGTPIKVIGTLHDITERKMMEKKLRESEEKFRTYVENANDIIFNLTLEGIFTYVSPNWTDVLGHDVAEVTGKSFVPYVHPDDVHKCEAFLNKVLSTGTRQKGVEYRVLHKQGYYRWHSATGAPLWNDEGQVESFLGVARDITENK